MAQTRKVEKKAEQLRISNIGDIKARVGGILELPSGFVIKWRNPGGLRAFMASGKIPNALLPIIDKALKGGKGVDAKMEADLMKQLRENPEMLDEMMALYDSVAIKCFVEPKLYPVPDEAMVQAWNASHPDDPVDEPEDLRFEDRLYTDEIPDDDKAYLFQLLSGGVKDLETFRKERSIDVDRLARVSGTVDHTIKPAGANAG